METHLSRESLTSLTRKVLWADAAVELVVALVLTGAVGRVHWWLNVERPVTLIAAVVFFAAAFAVAWMAWSQKTAPALVRYLAFANIAGGAALWLGAMLNWDRFESEGAWQRERPESRGPARLKAQSPALAVGPSGRYFRVFSANEVSLMISNTSLPSNFMSSIAILSMTASAAPPSVLPLGSH